MGSVHKEEDITAQRTDEQRIETMKQGGTQRTALWDLLISNHYLEEGKKDPLSIYRGFPFDHPWSSPDDKQRIYDEVRVPRKNLQGNARGGVP